MAPSTGTDSAAATMTDTPATAGDLAPYEFPGVPYTMGAVAFAHN